MFILLHFFKSNENLNCYSKIVVLSFMYAVCEACKHEFNSSYGCHHMTIWVALFIIVYGRYTNVLFFDILCSPLWIRLSSLGFLHSCVGPVVSLRIMAKTLLSLVYCDTRFGRLIMG